MGTADFGFREGYGFLWKPIFVVSCADSLRRSLSTCTIVQPPTASRSPPNFGGPDAGHGWQLRHPANFISFIPYTKWRLQTIKTPLYYLRMRNSLSPKDESQRLPINLRPKGATFTKNEQRRTMITIDSKPYFFIAFSRNEVFTTSLAVSFPSIMPWEVYQSIWVWISSDMRMPFAST